MEHPEGNEKPINLKRRVKFKIMSLKVKEGTEYVPELVSFYHDFLITITIVVASVISDIIIELW